MSGTTYTNYVEYITADRNKASPCLEIECEWIYTVPYPRLTAGGVYEIKFTAYKGRDARDKLLSTTDTRAFKINGQLPVKAELLNIWKGKYVNTAVTPLAKYIGSTASNTFGVYYTNQTTNALLIAGEAKKGYNLSIFNSSNNLMKTVLVTTNSSGYLRYQFALTTPLAEDLYSIRINDIEVGKMLYDKTLPTLFSVKALKNGTSNAVFPFVTQSESVVYQYTLSEETDENYMLSPLVPTEENSIITSRVYVEYSKNTNEGYEASLNVGNFVGAFAPAIYARDYAGNMSIMGNNGTILNTIKTNLATSVNAKTATKKLYPTFGIQYDARYWSTANIDAKNKAFDFRVFVDAERPDKVLNINTNTWNDGKDGTLADGISPERDRFATGGTRYVIRGDQLLINVRSEQWIRGVLMWGKNSSPNNPIILAPDVSNCAEVTETETNGVTQKFKTMCDLTYTFTTNSEGLQNAKGEAIDYYQFQFYPIDLSGNIPVVSNGIFMTDSVLIYMDKTGANNPDVQVSNLVSGKTLNTISDIIYTNSNRINLQQTGEEKSDSLAKMTNPKSVVTEHVLKKEWNETNQVLNLGTTAADTVTKIVDNRRVGDGEDGIYTISARDVDTAGNRGAERIIKVERDTVAPDTPTVSLVTSEGGTRVNLIVNGEPGTTAVISGASSAEGPIENPVQGIGYGNFVYDGQYNWNVQLRDKAGNLSGSAQASHRTISAPILTSYSLKDSTCAVADDKLVLPFEEFHNITTDYTPLAGPIINTPEYHTGLGFDMKNENILAAADGNVIGVGWNDQGGYMISIEHANGVITRYAHLSEWFVIKGANVKRGQLIGVSGNSGSRSGSFLHFQVTRNGEQVNPKDYLNKCEGQIDQGAVQDIRNLPEGFIGTDADPWNGKTYADVLAMTNSRNEIDEYVDVQLNTLKSTVSDTNTIITYIDQQPEKMTVYGITVARNASWMYRIHRKNYLCLVSDSTCVSENVTEVSFEKGVELELDIINNADLEGYKKTGALQPSYGKVSNIEENGRWSIEFLKEGENEYKSSTSGNRIWIGDGFSIGTRKKINYESIFGPSSVYDVKSNQEILFPPYQYNSIDQELKVISDWQVNQSSYYDTDIIRLNTRIVKLIPIGTIPANPTKINIVTHGWDKNGPSDTNRYNTKSVVDQDKGWVQWMNGGAKSDGTKYIHDGSSEMAIQIAGVLSENEPGTMNLALIWKDASVDLRTVWFPLNFAPEQPNEAARWITPVARVVAKHLSNINTSTMNCTGHSLGSLLCNVLGEEYEKNGKTADKLIALDPPAENSFNVQGYYHLDGDKKAPVNTSVFFDTDSGGVSKYNTSLGIVGYGSGCGNEDLAGSADTVLKLFFTNLETGLDDLRNTCLIHKSVSEIYRKMIVKDSSTEIKILKYGDINFSQFKKEYLQDLSSIRALGTGLFYKHTYYPINNTNYFGVVYGVATNDPKLMYIKEVVSRDREGNYYVNGSKIEGNYVASD